MRICALAYLQLFLVSMNTIVMVNRDIVLIAIVTMLLNFVWTYNVSGVTFATTEYRLLYAVSAALGAITGIYLITYITI